MNTLDEFYWWVAKMRRAPGGELVPRDGWELSECLERKMLMDGRDLSSIMEITEKERELEVLRG
jgi:hypothetical protein